MNTLVVGAGATGGYFGGLLARAGRDVTFLVRPRRAAQLRDSGLTVLTVDGEWSLTPTLVTPAELTNAFDLILLSVKAYSLSDAMSDLAPAVGPHTMILPGLNGMAHLDTLARRFGEPATLGGVMVLATTLDDQGRIVQLNPALQELTYGDRQDPRSERIRNLDPVLQGAGFTARRSEHISQDMWEKWVMLAATGAMTCLMRGNVGEIVSAPGGYDLAERLIDECAQVAEASGFPIRGASRRAIHTLMTDPNSTFTSSMYRDLTSGRPIEVEQIIGDLVSRAVALHLTTPTLTLTYTNLAVYQRRVTS
jgi:2-dehydropantoate 2-reductase